MQNPFTLLKPWTFQILQEIKREIKTEHLPNSPGFVRNHFGNRPTARLTSDEIFEAYQKDLLAGDEGLIEWVVNRWVFRNPEIYDHFADRLEKINANYDAIEKLTVEESEKILEGAKERFGAVPLYVFSVLNQVVFPASVFDRLEEEAVKAQETEKKEKEEKAAFESIEKMKEQYEREIARLEDKFEKRFAGIMRKYTQDIEGYKKQIRTLQKKIS